MSTGLVLAPPPSLNAQHNDAKKEEKKLKDRTKRRNKKEIKWRKKKTVLLLHRPQSTVFYRQQNMMLILHKASNTSLKNGVLWGLNCLSFSGNLENYGLFWNRSEIRSILAYRQPIPSPTERERTSQVNLQVMLLLRHLGCRSMPAFCLAPRLLHPLHFICEKHARLFQPYNTQ